MEKSIFTDDYVVLLELLKETRQAAKLTQVEFAKRIGQSQSFVSKIEVGERRLDIFQLRAMCIALGTNLPDFIIELEKRLQKKTKAKKKRTN